MDVLENTTEDSIAAIEETQVSLICSRSQKYDNERERHLLNHERWFKKRFGIRPASVNWPWPGASNLHLPLIDKTIRRSKPNFYNAIIGVTPTVTFKSTVTGDDLQMVRGIERRFDDMLHDEMEIFRPLAHGVDKMLERGYFTVKVIQEFFPEVVEEKVNIKEKFSPEVQDFIYSPETTEDQLIEEMAKQFDMDLDDDSDKGQIQSAIDQIKRGENIIKFQRSITKHPHPSLFVKEAANIIVPPDTCDIRDSRMIEDRIPMTCEDILERIESGKWDKDNGYELLRDLGYNTENPEESRTGTNPDKKENARLEEAREGVEGMSEELPIISEFYVWFRWPGDKLPSRCVLTCSRKHPKLPLRFRKYKYEAVDGTPAKWPFAQVTFEVVGDRYHSPRGYAQMLDSLQTELVNNHNAKQNYMSIANSMNFKVKKTANIATGWIPGQPFYVNRMDDVEEMNIGQRDLSFDNEERILKGWAEEYIGLLDQTLVQPTGGGMGGAANPRTKAEIDAVQAITVSVAGSDLQIFQILGMNVVYRMIWERWMQYGPDKIKYIDGMGNEKEVDKQEIKNRLKMMPTGNIGNVSKQTRLARAANRFQLFNGNQRVNQGELIKDYLVNDDDRLIERLYVPEANIQQAEIERQIFENTMIGQGYQIVPKPEDDDATHMQVIDDLLKDPIKRSKFPADMIEKLVDHRSAHDTALQHKKKASTKDGRAQQEVAKVAMGAQGREARE